MKHFYLCKINRINEICIKNTYPIFSRWPEGYWRSYDFPRGGEGGGALRALGFITMVVCV